jgi:hypothetical protein
MASEIKRDEDYLVLLSVPKHIWSYFLEFLLTFSSGQINGPLAAWRYQFMIIGSITSVWGIVVYFVLPDSPLTAYFLTQEQKIVAVERMRFEQIGIENKTVKKEQIKEAFTDPKTWFYVAAAFLTNFTNGLVTGFGSIVVKSFGVCCPITTMCLRKQD